jgi:hypothetical protein
MEGGEKIEDRGTDPEIEETVSGLATLHRKILRPCAQDAGILRAGRLEM